MDIHPVRRKFSNRGAPWKRFPHKICRNNHTDRMQSVEAV